MRSVIAKDLKYFSVTDYYKATVLLHTTVLQQMQHLTQLQLSVESRADELLQHISTMTDLQNLRLHGHLQLSVTQLTSLTKLQRLGLRGASLGHAAAESAANAVALLAWLPSLPFLSSLQLRDMSGLVGRTAAALNAALYPAPTAYSALTAGSALQHIDFRRTECTKYAWQHMFPTTRSFTAISSLRLWPRSDFELQLMDAVRCCPNLQQLQAGGATLRHSDFQQLQQRTSLTMLTLDRYEYTLRSKPIRLLTQLKSLQLLGLRVYTAQGLYAVQDLTTDLQRLTSLTQLSYLSLEVTDRGTHSTDAASPDSQCLSQFDHLRSVFDGMVAETQLRNCLDTCIMWSYVSQVSMSAGPCNDAVSVMLSNRTCCTFRKGMCCVSHS
jgi:hypothetical protein